MISADEQTAGVDAVMRCAAAAACLALAVGAACLAYRAWYACSERVAGERLAARAAKSH